MICKRINKSKSDLEKNVYLYMEYYINELRGKLRDETSKNKMDRNWDMTPQIMIYELIEKDLEDVPIDI